MALLHSYLGSVLKWYACYKSGGGADLGDDGIVLYLNHDDGCMLHMFIKFWDWHTKKGEFYTMQVIFISKFKNNNFKSRVLTYLKIMFDPTLHQLLTEGYVFF